MRVYQLLWLVLSLEKTFLETKSSFPCPQVLIYTEDFKSERADRERAQGQIDDLKEQVHQLKRQLHKQVRRQTLKESDEFLQTVCPDPNGVRL